MTAPPGGPYIGEVAGARPFGAFRAALPLREPAPGGSPQEVALPKVTDHRGRPVSGLMPGIVEAIVIDNVDPDKLGRVKVKYPTLPEMPESPWARVAVPSGGAHTGGVTRGWVSLPEIDDEVLVTFMHGDFNYPVVIGAVYNGVDTPPYANEDEENNLRVFQSRSGHRVTFDDTDGAERVEFILHNEEVRMIYDAAEKSLAIYTGKNLIIEAGQKITVECMDWVLQTDQSISMKAGANFDIQNGAELIEEAGAELAIKGTQTMLN